MSRFVENAAKILEAAETAVRNGGTASATTILIRPDGSLELLSDSESPLDTLQMNRGAEMIYRVTHHHGRLRVEGRSGSQTCAFESEKPEALAHRLLQPPLRGEPLAIAPTGALPLARTWPPPPEEWD